MIKSILVAMMLCSCLNSRPAMPTNTENEKHWKQEYADGKISYAEYQSLLKGEKELKK